MIVRSHPTECNCARAARELQVRRLSSRFSAPRGDLKDFAPRLARSATGAADERIRAAWARAPTSIQGAASRTRTSAASGEDACRRTESRCVHTGGAAKRRRFGFFAAPNSPQVTSNGEVEGPRAGARSEPRVHTAFPHPRRHYRLSRTPRTIVR
jgi:hypothetical protein